MERILGCVSKIEEVPDISYGHLPGISNVRVTEVPDSFVLPNEVTSIKSKSLSSSTLDVECDGFPRRNQERLDAEPSKDDFFGTSIEIIEETPPNLYEECDEIPHEKERGDTNMNNLVKNRKISRENKKLVRDKAPLFNFNFEELLK